MGAPFRQRASARGGSLPRPTGWAEERKASRPELAPPAVVPPRHSPLTYVAWARPGPRSISLETNLVLITHATEYLRHAPGAAPGQQRNCSFLAVQPETADESHRRGVVPPLHHSAHPDANTSAGFASDGGWLRQERRYRRGVCRPVCSLPLTAAEAATTQPCPGWTTRPPSPCVWSMRLPGRHLSRSVTRDSRVIPP